MEKWSLSLFELKDYLGGGSSGKVYKAYCKKYNTFFALKIIPLTNNSYEQNKVYREYETMIKAKNFPNLVKVYGFFEDNLNVQPSNCLILEFIEGKDLSKFINDNYLKINKHMEQDLLLNIFYQIANGLGYLHQNGIMHRDIAADNIMIDKNGQIKITDFGLSAFYIKNENIDDFLVYKNTAIGRRFYASDELYAKHTTNNQNISYDIKNDIFSFGITIFKLMTFGIPERLKYRTDKNVNFIEKINEDIYCKNLIELVMCMIDSDPNKRPTCKEIMNTLNNIQYKIIPAFQCTINCLQSFRDIYDYLINNEFNFFHNDLQLPKYSFIKNFNFCLKELNPKNLNLFINSFYETTNIYAPLEILYPIDILKVIFDYFLTNSPYTIFTNEKGQNFSDKYKQYYEADNKKEIANKIDEFKSLYKNIFVKEFYFLVLKTYKCPDEKCNAEIKQTLEIKNTLDLYEDNLAHKISDLFKIFSGKKTYLNLGMVNSNLPYLTCKSCGKMSKFLDEYNEIVLAPEVLIINLMFPSQIEEYFEIQNDYRCELKFIIYVEYGKNTLEFAKKDGNMNWKNLLDNIVKNNKICAKTLFYRLEKNEFSIFSN